MEATARQSRGEKRKAADDTAGAGWGHMRAPTLTPELKRELLIVKMRGVLDSKRFYRSADGGKTLPKYFQMGTIVSGADDGRQNKLTKRERKGSMLQELMGDEAVRKRAKKQFLKHQAEASAGKKRKSNNRGPSHKQKKGRR